MILGLSWFPVDLISVFSKWCFAHNTFQLIIRRFMFHVFAWNLTFFFGNKRRNMPVKYLNLMMYQCHWANITWKCLKHRVQNANTTKKHRTRTQTNSHTQNLLRCARENWQSLWYHYTANGLIIQIQGAFIVTPRTVTTQINVVITWFPLCICLWKSLFRFMSRHIVNKSHNTQSLNQSLTKHLLYFSTQCFFRCSLSLCYNLYSSIWYFFSFILG